MDNHCIRIYFRPTAFCDFQIYVTYNYYDTGEANKGLTYNLIMNNNNGGSQFDLAAVTLDRDYYFRITDIAGEEIDPNNPDGDSEPESEAAFVPNQNNFLK